MTGKIYVGVGGWTFEPWRGTFYPKDLSQKRELEYASRKLTSIEINGTYYSSFKPASWAKWRAETPDGFIFALKASRYCTNRRQLAEASESVQRFVAQGLTELGDRLYGGLRGALATRRSRYAPSERHHRLAESTSGAEELVSGPALPAARATSGQEHRVLTER